MGCTHVVVLELQTVTANTGVVQELITSGCVSQMHKVGLSATVGLIFKYAELHQQVPEFHIAYVLEWPT